jgi:hypothetical protein
LHNKIINLYLQTTSTITINIMSIQEYHNNISQIKDLKAGEYLLTTIEQSKVPAYARTYQKKVKTESCLLIHDYKTDNPKTTKLTKITIL